MIGASEKYDEDDGVDRISKKYGRECQSVSVLNSTENIVIGTRVSV